MKTVITHDITKYSLLWVIILIVFSPTLHSQSFSLPVKNTSFEYNFEEIKFPNGAPIRDVVGIVQDKYGFVWLASKHGLCRYDGHDFKVFRHQLNDPNSIVDTDVRNIEIFNDTTLFIGCDCGLSIMNLKTGKFTNYPTDNGSSPSRIMNDFEPDDSGNIWIAGLSGLYSLPPDRKRIVDHQLKVPKTIYSNTPAANQVYYIAKHPSDKNILLLGTEYGLISFDIKKNKIHKTYPNEEISKLPYSYPSVTDVKVDGQYVWCRSWEAGLNRFDLMNEQWENYGFPTFEGNSPLSIGTILFKNKKELWIIDNNHSNGLGIFNKKTGKITFAKNIKPEFGLPLPETPLYLYLTPDSTLWLSSTTGKGLFKQNKKIFRFHTLDIPYTGKVVSDIFYDKSNKDYYVGMLINSIGIGKWNTVTEKWTFIKPIGNPDPSDFPAYLFFQDRNGTLWVATGKRSLWYVDKKENVVKPFLFPNGEPIDNEGYSIVGLFEDSRKQLWIGTSANGIICLNKERTKAVYYKHDDNDSSSLIKGTHFRAIEEDNHGRLWFGNNMGFCVFEPKTGKFSHQIADELSATGVRIGTTTTILRDTIGRMWLTVEGQGLVRITESENGKMSFKTYRNEEGLKDLTVRYMTKDKNGCFWIVNNGLLYFNPYDETYMLTDASNGMLNSYSNDDRITVDEYGNVFTSNQVGIQWMDVVRQQSQNAVKNLMIEQITLNGNPIEWHCGSGERMILKHVQNNITFNYTSVCFEETDQIRYRYRLSNIEKDWNPPTTLLQARYLQLKPGKYRFEVNVSYKGKWLNNICFTDFEIRQVYWKTWWFILLLTLFAATGVFGIFRYRLTQLIKLRKLRVKIASDLHDDVGSTLSSISIMSDLLQSQLDNTPRSEQMIQEIGANAHIMLDSMDDIIWSVNPSNDKFQNLALRIREYAIPLFEMKDITFSIITQDEMKELSLLMDVRRNIYLIAKEAVNNLVKYSECTKASIEFSHDHNVLRMIVKDNGKGFDMGKVNTSRNGLKNMQRRTEQIKGKLDISSDIGKGTCIAFSVKII